MNIFSGRTKQLIGMSSKVITLGLDQVGWEFSSAVAIIEGQGCGKAGGWHSQQNGLGNNLKETFFFHTSQGQLEKQNTIAESD